jgi:hypothetical protein
VTHGSFPGRPRGRRARPDNEGSEWAGFDATPADQREFPDLAPIRPREARVRDGRAQDDWQAQGQAGSYGAGYPGDASGQGYPPTGPGQQGGGYQGGGYPGDAYGGPAQGGAGEGGQAPWQDQPWPGQQPSAQPVPQAAAVQPAVVQQAAPKRRARGSEQDADAPEWAGPDADAVESFSARWSRRGMDTRDDRRADRAKRRRLLIAGAVAGALAVGAAAYLVVKPGHSSGPGFGQLVTSFLPGELQSVPDACASVPVPLLNQYLPGNNPKNTRQAKPPLNTGANTQCTWSLDNAPTYRVLMVTLQAYAPSALYGNGSATFAAETAYTSFEDGFASPGPESGLPSATVTDLVGLPGGTGTSAFVATQVFNREGSTTDVASVLVRYRNVIVTVVLNGLNHSNKGNYGPVAMSDLSSAATKIARQVATQVVG